MSEEVKKLMEMGFSQPKSERALAVTNFKGVEAAMEWLLAHANEQDTEDVNINEQSEVSGNEAGSLEAKSLRCDDCGKLFKTQLEVEFHASKTEHSNFSESTEEKKPLTEEEKKEQLAKLEERMKQKRKEREEKEKEEAREKEKLRIRSGKDMLEAKKKLEDVEIMKMVEDRRREKEEDKRARDRVRAQIEADKAARRMKAAGVDPNTAATIPPVEPIVASVPSPAVVAKDYSSTRLQIRLPDGSALTQTFGAKEQLSAVRLFIQMNKMNDDQDFTIMTSFPRKVFTSDDYEKPLDILGLVPSAVVIVTRVTSQ